MTLTFKATGRSDLLGVVDQFGRVGSIWLVTPDMIVEDGTEDDVSAEDLGWHFDLDAPRLTTRAGGPYESIKDAVKAVQDVYEEFAADRAQEQRFDHRQGKRVVGIPSGGQPRK
ncbi:hypothetical protein [Streptomyces sp. NPDC006631]|uniref:hypothetical protein n=1 Tax=Streptomyces sp. NPDC006631 TaxID=3364752 RepID=UPI0036C8A915